MGDLDSRTVVIVDADAIVALAGLTDANHQKAVKISEELQAKNVQLIYPLTALVEGVTAIQRVLSNGVTAYGTAVSFTDFADQVEEVGQETYQLAVNDFFSPETSKKNTLFDCIVAAVARKKNADAIFSFDKFYKSKGFKLASEII